MMKIYFLIILVFSFRAYGQTSGQADKGSLFSKKELRHPLKVKVADLSGKRLKKLPAELIKFKNLDEINLSENPNMDLFEAFQFLRNFKRLKRLHLNSVNDSIPDNISALESIEELNLERNQLTMIPEGVKKMPGLRKLTLWGNKISMVSLQSGDLPYLEEIDFGLNQLAAFPDDLPLLPNLKIISVYHNMVSLVSPGIKNLHRLEELDLRANKLSNLPTEFGELKALKKLDLLENQLSLITPLLSLTSLEELKIGDNIIEEIPARISGLKKIKNLSLSFNPLKAVPEIISELQSLEYISIDGHDSAKLPAWLSLAARLPKLETINISMNGIKAMPPEFEKLIQVNSFFIWECDLTRPERQRLRALFPKASFNFHKSWGDRSFYKYKPCSMEENGWDTISAGNLTFRYLLVGQSYKSTDKDGIHYWDGNILLDLDKKTVDKEAAEKILTAIADRLGLEDITAARTCRVFTIMHAAMPPQTEEEKKYYEDNFIGKYYRMQGLKRY